VTKGKFIFVKVGITKKIKSQKEKRQNLSG